MQQSSAVTALALIPTVGFLLLFVGIMRLEIEGQVGLASDAAKSAEPTRAVYDTTAVQLYRDYEANEVATDEKIGTARIRISGIVKSIDKDMLGDPEINLYVGTEFSSVGLAMDKSELSVAGSLSRGQSIVARCDKVTRIIDHPVAEHCQVI